MNFDIESSIMTLRGQKVMLDMHLAELYEIPTKRLNEQVKRNLSRFPPDFMFQLNSDEWALLRSQIATSNRGGRNYLPYAFTEHGVLMLSSVLSSEKAVEVNIAIMRVFVKIRDLYTVYKELQLAVLGLEKRVGENESRLEQVLHILQDHLCSPSDERTRIGFRIHD